MLVANKKWLREKDVSIAIQIMFYQSITKISKQQ
jgi:hypothetical protein